jgi:hypothetical protein
MEKREKIDGYTLTIRMRKTRRRYPLTATEQALYNELVAICNEDEWEDIFSCSNDELCAALRISENTLDKARLTLIQAGLLFYKSGKSKRQFGQYSFIIKLTTAKIEVDTGTNKGTNAETNRGTNAADYIKTESKTETKILSGEKPGKKKKVTSHWEFLKKIWFDFYEQTFQLKPKFAAAQAKHLADILSELEKVASSASEQWTEEVAGKYFKKFLFKALRDEWLKKNFLLSNLSSHFDKIVTPVNDGTTTNRPANNQTNRADLVSAGQDTSAAILREQLRELEP